MRFAAVIVAVIALIALGVHDAAVSSQRAALAADPKYQQRLDSIPMTIGAWTGETLPPDEAQTKHSTAFARLQRVYRRGGLKPAVITMLVLAGVPGELGAHDPERCYGGVGFKAEGDRSYKMVSDGDYKHALWSRKFQAEAPPYGRIDVAWGWTAEGHWQASDDARTEFAGRELIHKIYVSRPISPSADAKIDEPDPSVEFLTDFVPLARIAIAGAKN